MNNCNLDTPDNAGETGHIFCSDCATELVIKFDKKLCYVNPRYESDWDVPWHDFHNVRVVAPAVLKALWDGEIKFTCPYCSNTNQNKFIVMDKGMFDIKLILQSMTQPRTKMYKCIHCDGEFASQDCVMKVKYGYICNDCAMVIQGQM